jgi:hypothetical protein
VALQKDTFSISLAQGVNEKVDDKIAGPEQVTSIRDRVFDKEGRTTKRFGQSVKSTSVQTSFPNPLTITTSSVKSKTFAHENQLCLQNNGALYSQMSGQDKWQFKGHCLPVGVDVAAIQSGTAFTDIVSVSGTTVAAGAGYVYVKEDATGVVIAITAVSNVLRLVAFSNAVWVLWGSVNTLKAQQVNLSTGALGTAVDLRTDLVTSAVAKNVTVAVTSSSSLVGEMAFIGYCSSSPKIKIAPMDSSGVTPALGVLDTGTNGAVTTCLSIYVEPTLSANKFYLATSNSSTVLAGAWTFTAGAYTNVFGLTSVFTPTTGSPTVPRLCTMVINPINNTDLYLFFDTVYSNQTRPVGDATNSADAGVFYIIMSLTGTVTTSATAYGYGYQLASVPVRDTSRLTIYIACVVYSPLQTTLIFIDILKGKSDTSTFVIAKVLYGKAAQAAVLSKLRLVSGSSTTYRMTNNGYVIDLSLAPTNASSHQYIAKTTHFTGGLLWAYDGNTIAEHGFLIDPELCELYVGQANMSLVVNQVGDGAHKEQWTLTLQSGAAFKSLSTNLFTSAYGWLQFNTLIAGYYLWFKIDGVGNDPAPGGRTGILVSILSTDTTMEVTYKAQVAMQAAVSGTYNFASPNSFSYELTGNGAVTAPSLNGNYTTTGGLGAGSYQFSVVWLWTDRNGNEYRSAPMVAQTATAAASDRAAMIVYAPAITNKTVSEVHVEVYRTQVNSTELQLVSSTPVMSTSIPRVQLDLSGTDASINANEIIYTNDGTLENFNIGACTAVSSFKNRLIVSAVDDPTAPYYSRTNLSTEPVNFSAFNQIRIDQDGQPVTAHAQMDDKLVLFKASCPFVTAGDGSNDLGQGESFTLPMRIPGDFGTSNPNSLALCTAGLIFQTPTKGIHVLTRGLSVEYIGAQVDDYKSNVVSGAVMAQNYEHIIFSLSDSTTSLIYNYRFNRWDFFTNQQGDSACLWQGAYARAKNNGKVYVESALYYDVDGSNLAINSYTETVWLKLKSMQTFARIYSAMLLGEYISPHTLTIQVGFDFDPTLANYETHTFDATTVIGGGGTQPGDQTYQVEVQPARQKCNAIKFKITETPGTGTQAGAYWNALDFYVGLKPGLNRVKADKGI